MKPAIGDQLEAEKEEARRAGEDVFDLSCAAGILMYLSKKTEAFTDVGISGPWSRE